MASKCLFIEGGKFDYLEVWYLATGVSCIKNFSGIKFLNRD